ncbi:pentatricopeptide repeat-containing protein At1g20230-like [Asparagus officinalis]|nr:pentatricopeptide repeat-containing protein At1g20230-like [Asparagus officinalis]
MPASFIGQFKSYLNCGQLNQARNLFDKIPNPNIYSSTLLISAYTKQNRPLDSIQLYQNLRKEKKLQPDNLLLLSITKACALLSDPIKAKEIHKDVIGFGFKSDLPLGNALIEMYGKCGLISEAQQLFDELPVKDVITWTSLILSYKNCKQFREGLGVFREMLISGPKLNSVTLLSVLAISSKLKSLKFGREIHCFVIRNGFEDNMFIGSGLVDIYSKCLITHDARIVFDGMRSKDVVSWNVILSAYSLNGDLDEALRLFDKMKVDGVLLNSASWNSMISGCVQNGRIERALQFFAQMQDSGTKPNHITIASILPACTGMESIRGGREIHGYVYRNAFIKDIIIDTGLVLMYAKCGDLNTSRLVFDQMPRKDIIAWNTMIVANSMHGCGKETLTLFDKMIESGIRPDAVTFSGVLSGCSHSQLVDKARQSFSSMEREYGLNPDADHYASMVDVLSRAGYLNEAYEFIQNMPVEPTPSAWGALLNGCKVYKNTELGKIAGEVLLDIEPQNPGNYLSLLNIFVGAKMYDDASRIRMLMNDRGIRKEPGCSWVQIKNKVYTFVKGDDRFAMRNEVYGFLKETRRKMRVEGYMPDTDIVLQDVDGEEKEEVLCSHSEKLAVAFAILNLDRGEVIRVFKNLRICGDCHGVISFMAKSIGVCITVRDSVRFHHFKDGSCSCKNLW